MQWSLMSYGRWRERSRDSCPTPKRPWDPPSGPPAKWQKNYQNYTEVSVLYHVLINDIIFKINSIIAMHNCVLCALLRVLYVLLDSTSESESLKCRRPPRVDCWWAVLLYGMQSCMTPTANATTVDCLCWLLVPCCCCCCFVPAELHGLVHVYALRVYSQSLLSKSILRVWVLLYAL